MHELQPMKSVAGFGSRCRLQLESGPILRFATAVYVYVVRDRAHLHSSACACALSAAAPIMSPVGDESAKGVGVASTST